jgi:hypothetical protein
MKISRKAIQQTIATLPDLSANGFKFNAWFKAKFKEAI